MNLKLIIAILTLAFFYSCGNEHHDIIYNDNIEYRGDESLPCPPELEDVACTGYEWKETFIDLFGNWCEDENAGNLKWGPIDQYLNCTNEFTQLGCVMDCPSVTVNFNMHLEDGWIFEFPLYENPNDPYSGQNEDHPCHGDFVFTVQEQLELIQFVQDLALNGNSDNPIPQCNGVDMIPAQYNLDFCYQLPQPEPSTGELFLEVTYYAKCEGDDGTIPDPDLPPDVTI